MTEEALMQLWNTYSDAWSEKSAEKRGQMLAASLAQDVAFTSPDVDDRGVDQLEATMVAFQAEYVGYYFRTNMLRHQHGQLLIAWTLFDAQDAPLLLGNSYARLDEERGKIVRLAGFWKR
ncbi:MAG: hypothetical protein PW792_05620 [Acidobacteriaceae bacterium]|nr:hypothetical protein [Acidobacteriaceae bacterium]